MGEEKKITPVRKRRKVQEPPKFGKLERILVLFLVAITVITSAVLGAKARGFKPPQINLPNPNLSSTIVLESLASKDPDPKTLLQEKTKNLQGDYGVYVIDIKTGKSYGVLEQQKFEGASLFKLPLIIAIYENAETGNFNIDKYKDLIEAMGKHSDNSAFVTMLGVVGMPKVKAVMDQIGMQNTSYSDSTTTPYDIALLFQKLMQGKLVSDKSRDEILKFLTDTDFEDWIVPGVPKDIVVAHKYGKVDGVINDAGVVFAPNPYIVVIMSQNVDESEVTNAIPEISKAIYDLQK